MPRRRSREHRLAASLALAWLFWGCAVSPPPAEDLLAAAIAARGGALPHVARESEVELYTAMPGRWRWRLELDGSQRMRFTLRTDGEDQHWTSDGEVASTWLGSARLTGGPLEGSEAESVARWVAIRHLDALADPARFRWVAVEADALPAAFSHGIEAWATADPASRYRLLFDRRLRLVALRGPLSLPVIGGGQVHAAFTDFREVDGFELSFAARYELGGARFFDEEVVEQSVRR